MDLLAFEHDRGFVVKALHRGEKLVEAEGIEVSRETVWHLLRVAGVRSPQKRWPPKYRSRPGGS